MKVAVPTGEGQQQSTACPGLWFCGVGGTRGQGAERAAERKFWGSRQERGCDGCWYEQGPAGLDQKTLPQDMSRSKRGKWTCEEVAAFKAPGGLRLT